MEMSRTPERAAAAGSNVFANKDGNAFGLYRMHMGVLEWCLDDYGVYRTDRTDTTDPLAIYDGKRKVARGGDDGYFEQPTNKKIKLESKDALLRYIRSASRAHFHPGLPYPIIGLRPVLAPAVRVSLPTISKDMLIEPMGENL